MGAPAADWAETGTFTVGKYKCTITAGPGGASCEWEPEVPGKVGLTKKELRRYRAERDKIYQRAANRMGGSIMVVDVCGRVPIYSTISPIA